MSRSMCSGPMKPDINVGGNIATISEVPDDKKTTDSSPEIKKEAASLVLDQGMN